MPPETPRCRACAAEVSVTNRFCPACGVLDPAQASDATASDQLRSIAADVAALLREKAGLAAELERLAMQSGERELNIEERGQWERAYTRWRDVASEITLLVDRLHPRSDTDRRTRSTPPPTGTERRSQEDRRDPFWTRAP